MVLNILFYIFSAILIFLNLYLYFVDRRYRMGKIEEDKSDKIWLTILIAYVIYCIITLLVLIANFSIVKMLIVCAITYFIAYDK